MSTVIISFSRVLFFILLYAWPSYCNNGLTRTSKCLDSFLNKVKVLPGANEIIGLMKSRPEVLSELSLSRLSDRAKIVVDATFGAAHSLFHHITQLNGTGIDLCGNYSRNCVVAKSSVSTNYYPTDQMLYFKLGPLEWLHLLEDFPHALVVVNDLNDTEWYNFLHPSVKLKLNGDLASDFRTYGSLSLPDVELLRKSYRDLVTCAVPTQRLLSVDLSSITSEEYWQKLTQFLGISLPVSVMKQLVNGGVEAPLKMNEVCQAGGPKAGCGRTFWDVSPSICEIAATPALTEEEVTLNQHLKQCAADYSSTVGKLFGQSEFASLLYNRMMEAPTAIRRADKTTQKLIVNAGPGTTGTRTLHLVMSQLNVTARHYRKNTGNCSFAGVYELHSINEIDSDMRVLLRDEASVGPVVYWGDTPAPERWWHLMKMYPRTRIIMTDVRNDTMWLTKRLAEHCSNASSRVNDVWSPCTIPVPVGFERWTPLSLRFHRASHLSSVNASVAGAAFDAYRQLIRCAVPKKQLTWIYMLEQNNATKFWNQIFSFINIPLSEKVKTTLIDAGMPRWSSSKGCSIGGKKCSMGRHGKDAVNPSVCTIAV